MPSLCDQCSRQIAGGREPVVRIAQCDREVIQALELVYRAYLRSGFIGPNPFRLRVTPYHLLATSQVLVSFLDGQAITTTTLIGDGELGLPMEDLYGDEVGAKRQAGLRLAEVSCLADRRRDFERSFATLVQLMSLTAQAAAHQGIDQLLIAVHPRHGAFYQRFFGFELIGGLKSYEAVNNKPAVALALDLNHIAEHCPRGHDRLFGKPFSAEELQPRTMSDALMAYLAEAVGHLYPARNPSLEDNGRAVPNKGYLELVG